MVLAHYNDYFLATIRQDIFTQGTTQGESELLPKRARATIHTAVQSCIFSKEGADEDLPTECIVCRATPTITIMTTGNGEEALQISMEEHLAIVQVISGHSFKRYNDDDSSETNSMGESAGECEDSESEDYAHQSSKIDLTH